MPWATIIPRDPVETSPEALELSVAMPLPEVPPAAELVDPAGP